MARTVLVIGATGILAPAASALTERGDRVIGVSRHGALAVDARDADQLTAALQGHAWDDALVYAPAVSEASLAHLRSATPGRTVLVQTSAAADPVRGDAPLPRDVLQLGWTAERPPRWHTPAEVSALALDVLADGKPRTLGVVRPWEDRP